MGEAISPDAAGFGEDALDLRSFKEHVEENIFHSLFMNTVEFFLSNEYLMILIPGMPLTFYSRKEVRAVKQGQGSSSYNFDWLYSKLGIERHFLSRENKSNASFFNFVLNSAANIHKVFFIFVKKSSILLHLNILNLFLFYYFFLFFNKFLS